MFTRPHEGAETLDDTSGREAIICRDAATAVWIERLTTSVGALVSALESASESRIIRAQLGLAQVWRTRPEDL